MENLGFHRRPETRGSVTTDPTENLGFHRRTETRGSVTTDLTQRRSLRGNVRIRKEAE